VRGVGWFLLAALAAAAANAETLRLDRTDPQHMPPQHPPPAEGEPLPQYPVRVRPRIVYSLPGKLADWAKEDTMLSRLCRRGSFVQRQDRFFWARTPQRSYGVAFPTGDSLVDLAKKAKTTMAYFFEDQDGDCQVYPAPMAKLMPYYKP
jgi:hypothetical protein